MKRCVGFVTCSVVQQRPSHGTSISDSSDCKGRVGTIVDALESEIEDFARYRTKTGRKALDLVLELLLSLELLQKRMLWLECLHELLG
jgi:hypothetical protein